MRLILTISMLFSLTFLFAQNNDCINAEVICDNNQINYNPSGPGANDFASGSNDNGCLSGNEHQSAWYYFEFQADMPANSVILFTIDPEDGDGEDYDFAIYGPDPVCDDLGTPIRCSFASGACDFCPATGLGNGATDTSEDATGDGFVLPLSVQPGQGFYLLIDNYESSAMGFDLDWSGSAASYLNCEATPECSLEVSELAPLEVCPASPAITLPAIVTGSNGSETYLWTATNGGAAFLSATNIPNPSVNIPADATGTFIFTLTVNEGSCIAIMTTAITVTPPFTVDISGPTTACIGSEVTLNVTGSYASYQWSNGESNAAITVTETGTFTVNVMNAENCMGTQSIDVDFSPLAPPVINGTPIACQGEEITLSVDGNYANYQWSNGNVGQSVTVTTAGNLSVEVINDENCVANQSIELSFNTLPQPEITGDNAICEGEFTTFNAGEGFVSYAWSNNQNGQSIDISNNNDYTVTVTDANGCEGTASQTLLLFPLPTIQIQGEDYICEGGKTILSAGNNMQSYLWNTGEITPAISVENEGVYEVIVSDQNNCSSSSDFTVNISKTQLEFSQTDPLCFEDNDGVIKIDLTKGGLAPYQYSWNGDDFGNKNFLSGLPAGVYKLNVRDAIGCEIEQSFTINEGVDVQMEIGEDQYLTLGEESEIEAIINIPTDEISNITWTPANIFDCLGCMEQQFLPYQTVIVTAEVEDERGCKATREVTIFVDKTRDVFIPNAFSPNDDGINDFLTIYTGRDVAQINSFQIFNRWGNPVFEQTDFQANDNYYGWDGKTIKDLNTGVFVYTAEVLFIDGVTKRFSGEVILMR